MDVLRKDEIVSVLIGYLPYKLKARYYDSEAEREDDDAVEGVVFDHKEPEFYIFQYAVKAGQFKPYLRPMYAMTEEEKKHIVDMELEYKGKFNQSEFYMKYFDYLNSIHVDYRGLIPMGLALPAPEGMYKIE